MPDLPEAFLGITEVRQSAFFGLWKRRKKIGLEFRRCGDFQHSTDAVEFDVGVDLFANPPTLFMSNGGVMKVNFRNRAVAFASSDGNVRLRGELSDDMQRINGTVDIQSFQLMDVTGDFFESPIVLEATEVENDEG